MVQKGDRVKDAISGFEGIATCMHDFLYGCMRVSVTAEKPDKDGKPLIEVFDAGQLQVLAEAAVKYEPEVALPTGGDDRMARAAHRR